MKFYLKVIFLLVFSSVIVAEEGESNQIPLELFVCNPQQTRPRLSPDGEQIAFLKPDANNVLNVFVRGMDERPEEARQVTMSPKRAVHAFFWQLDNEHILFIQDKDGDENWHLYQANIETKETQNLTPYPGVRAAVVADSPSYPDTLLIGLNQRNEQLFDIYRLNLTTGDLQLDTQNPGDVIHWVADHELNVRAAMAQMQDGAHEVRVRDSVDDEWRTLLTVAPDETDIEIVAFSPDSQALYLFSSSGSDTARLVQLDIQTGIQSVIAQDAHYDLSSVMIHPLKNHLEAVGGEKECFEWQLLDPSLKSDFESLATQIGAHFQVYSRDLNNTQWILSSVSDARPSHFYHYDRTTKALNFLFCTLPELERYQMSQMQPITFSARDGMQLYGYLTLPVTYEKDAKPLPTVLLVHGGPWSRDTWGFHRLVQLLANRGYAVLQINFRGSSGYGQKYMNAGDQEWGAKMQTDLLDGKAWLVNEGIADPQRVAIIGGSYGGYATLAALSFTPEEFCCGIDIVGPSNLLSFLKSIPAYWVPLNGQTFRRIGHPEKDAAMLQARSPLFKAYCITKPLFIVHGANDPRVKQAESDQIVKLMRENNIPVEYMLFLDEGHGVARPENNLRFYKRTEEFLAEHLSSK